MTRFLHTMLLGNDGVTVDNLMDAHHGVAVLFAEVVGAHPDPVAVVERAWVDTIAAVVVDPSTPVRASLLGAVLRLLREGDHLDDTIDTAAPPSREGLFLPPGDRWEGWWDIDMPSWPAGWVPTAGQVLRAVRRLPLRQRTLLVLRDAARLSTEETADLVGVDPADQGRLLDGARETYVACLDEEVGVGTVGVPDVEGRDVPDGRR